MQQTLIGYLQGVLTVRQLSDFFTSCFVAVVSSTVVQRWCITPFAGIFKRATLTLQQGSSALGKQRNGCVELEEKSFIA